MLFAMKEATKWPPKIDSLIEQFYQKRSCLPLWHKHDYLNCIKLSLILVWLETPICSTWEFEWPPLMLFSCGQEDITWILITTSLCWKFRPDLYRFVSFLSVSLAITGKLFIIDPFSFHSTWAVAGCRWNTTLQELTMDFGTEFEPQGEILNIKDQTGLWSQFLYFWLKGTLVKWFKFLR